MENLHINRGHINIRNFHRGIGDSRGRHKYLYFLGGRVLHKNSIDKTTKSLLLTFSMQIVTGQIRQYI